MKRFCFFLLFFFSFFVKNVFAQNLLTNGDFEVGKIDFWESSGGGATGTASSELVHEGLYSLRVENSKTSSYGVQQTIKDLEGGMFYEVSGYAATTDNNVANYFIKVAWYASSDGTGPQLQSPHETEKTNQKSGEWFYFSSIFQSPLEARSAKVRLVLNSSEAGILAWANFDNISFKESSAPTPTLTLTPVPTNTPVPESHPTSTPTLTPTPTVKPTTKPSPKPTPADPETVTTSYDGPQGEVLGDEIAPTGPGELEDIKALYSPPEKKKSILLPIFLIGGGGISIFFSVLSFLKKDENEGVD